MRITDLQLLQAGTNPSTDAYATTVAPTVKLMGIEQITVRPMVTVVQYDTRQGTLAPAYDADVVQEHAEVAIESQALYEDLPYWFDAVLGQATPATDVSGYAEYLYAAPLTDVATDYAVPRELDLVYGEEGTSSTDAVGVPGFIGKNFTLSAEIGAPWHISVNGMGAKTEADEIDASLADRSVNRILGSHAHLYIGTASDYSGSASDASTDCGLTEMANVAFSFNLSFESNRALVWHLGSITPDNYHLAKGSGTLTVSMEMDATSWGYLSSIIGAVSVFDKTVRLEGLDGSGAHCVVDFHGVSVNAPQPFTDKDGVITVELELTGQYDSTMGNYMKARVNSLVESLA